MKSGFLFVFVIAVSAHQVASQFPGFGQCPQVTPVQNFDLAKYLGHWYEIKAYRNIFEIASSCVTADVSLNADGTVQVVNSLRRFGQTRNVTLTATIPQQGVGALKVNFPGLPSWNNNPNYIVLATDYNTYSVVYSCYSLFGFANKKYAWVLSRNATLSAAAETEVQRVLTANNLSSLFFRNTNQANCN